jgi:hypothetical protein
MKIVKAIQDLYRLVKAARPVRGYGVDLEYTSLGTVISIPPSTHSAGGSDWTGPFDLSLEQGKNNSWTLKCFDSSMDDASGQAGLVYVGNATYTVPSTTFDIDAAGVVFLDVVYNDETQNYTIAISFANALPLLEQTSRRYVLRLGQVVRKGTTESPVYELQSRRLPNDIEVLGRWV